MDYFLDKDLLLTKQNWREYEAVKATLMHMKTLNGHER